jgi:UDP-N-acetylmuramoylalanine--D-glutamate ligase
MTNRLLEPVGVLGVGVEGRSVIASLQRRGIKEIAALDQDRVGELPDGVGYRFGPAYDRNLARFRTIFRSPGIRPDSPALEAARAAGSLVTSATSHFLEVCPAPVVGVTGTVGKGTAASLTARMLEAAGFGVHLGGNIGRSPLDFIDHVAGDHRVVLEISSFQAMDVARSPHVAVILKTTAEHLDWHRDLGEYLAAKAHLLSHQVEGDIVIFNEDSPGAKQVAASRAETRRGFSLSHPVEDGIFVEGTDFILVKQGTRHLLPLNGANVRLAGRFNLENVAAALLAALAMGAAPEEACRAAEGFEGLPHRLELAAEGGGVRYYNDSYATRPEAVIGAVGCFTDTPLALILGGSEKHAEFTGLARALQSHPSIRHVALMGETAQRLLTAINDAGPRGFGISQHENMAEAAHAASSALDNGGVVLLSPACASFGLFPNYKVRGERFRELASALANGHNVSK